MIDGRVIYSSIFSGMFWSVVSYVVEDLDRIEVIRGPGAALWGAFRHERLKVGMSVSPGHENHICQLEPTNVQLEREIPIHR